MNFANNLCWNDDLKSEDVLHYLNFISMIKKDENKLIKNRIMFILNKNDPNNLYRIHDNCLALQFPDKNTIDIPIVKDKKLPFCIEISMVIFR